MASRCQSSIGRRPAITTSNTFRSKLTDGNGLRVKGKRFILNPISCGRSMNGAKRYLRTLSRFDLRPFSTRRHRVKGNRFAMLVRGPLLPRKRLDCRVAASVASDHSRPGEPAAGPANVRHAPKATDTRLRTAPRDGPEPKIR